MKEKHEIPVNRIEQACSMVSRIVAEINGNFDLYAKNRKRENVQVRQQVHACLSLHTNIILANIALHCGGKDHATAIYSTRTIKNICDTNKNFKQMFDRTDAIVDSQLGIFCETVAFLETATNKLEQGLTDKDREEIITILKSCRHIAPKELYPEIIAMMTRVNAIVTDSAIFDHFNVVRIAINGNPTGQNAIRVIEEFFKEKILA